LADSFIGFSRCQSTRSWYWWPLNFAVADFTQRSMRAAVSLRPRRRHPRSNTGTSRCPRVLHGWTYLRPSAGLPWWRRVRQPSRSLHYPNRLAPRHPFAAIITRVSYCILCHCSFSPFGRTTKVVRWLRVLAIGNSVGPRGTDGYSDERPKCDGLPSAAMHGLEITFPFPATSFRSRFTAGGPWPHKSINGSRRRGCGRPRKAASLGSLLSFRPRVWWRCAFSRLFCICEWPAIRCRHLRSR
jgi:hypothetical protein